MTNYLDNKINEVFENIVDPSLSKIVKEYDGVNGYKASIVSNCPVIMGIGRYKSIQITHPNNLVHIICIYWIKGEESRACSKNWFFSFVINKTLISVSSGTLT